MHAKRKDVDMLSHRCKQWADSRSPVCQKMGHDLNVSLSAYWPQRANTRFASCRNLSSFHQKQPLWRVIVLSSLWKKLGLLLSFFHSTPHGCSDVPDEEGKDMHDVIFYTSHLCLTGERRWHDATVVDLLPLSGLPHVSRTAALCHTLKLHKAVSKQAINGINHVIPRKPVNDSDADHLTLLVILDIIRK